MERLKGKIGELMYGPVIAGNELLRAREELPGVVTLHISSLNAAAPGKKLVALYRGLRLIATTIENSQEAAHIRKIGAASWVVTKYPHIMEGLGFSVDREHIDPEGNELIDKYKIKSRMSTSMTSEMKSIEPTFASMNRDEFLRRYGNSVRPLGLEPRTAEV